MTTPAHAAVGLVLAKSLIARGFFSWVDPNQLYVLSILAANAPDIDGILFHKIYEHRDNSPFHYPFTWWVIFVSALVYVSASGQKYLLPYIYLALINIVVHFLMDTFGVNAGICWFAPFDKKEYSFLPTKFTKPKNLKVWINNYLNHPIMFVEVGLWTIGLIAWLN